MCPIVDADDPEWKVCVCANLIRSLHTLVCVGVGVCMHEVVYVRVCVCVREGGGGGLV